MLRRTAVDCLEYVRQLKDLGIGVIFEKENLNTLTMTSEFMIALYGSFAQVELESISKNVSLEKEKAYREGRVMFQYKYLLGYKRSYDRYDVYDSQDRRWKIMSDASIKCTTTKDGTPASKKYSVEIVTPILEYNDMAMLQEVVRSVRRNGGICNE